VGGGVKSKSNPAVLQIGCIVWAPIVPDGGVTKDRRSIVIEEPSTNLIDPVAVIGVTSDGGRYDPASPVKYPPAIFFAMPYAADGSDPTTFTIPCAAKITWVQEFRRTNIKPAGGMLTGRRLQELLDWIEAAEV